MLPISAIFAMVLTPMPITTSAKKALRASKRKRVVNLRRSRGMADAIKTVKNLLVEKNAAGAKAALSAAYAAIDKAAKRGVIKKNTASRAKSRVNALIKKSSK